MVSSANAANAARRKHARKLSHRGWAVASNRLALWARADRKIIQKLAKSEHRFARSVEADLASFSAKGAQRRPRPPRPLSPSPVSPNAEGASPRACLCFVAALGRDRRDWTGAGNCPTNGQGEFGRLLRSPPIPAELSANYARTQWNLAPLWRGFSFSENSLGRRPQKSPPAIGAAAALFQSESTVSPLVRFSRQCILSLRLLLSKDRPKRSRRGWRERLSFGIPPILPGSLSSAPFGPRRPRSGVPLTHIDRRQLHPRLTCGSNSGLIVTISPAGSASRASD
jgi:hypothetical protein